MLRFQKIVAGSKASTTSAAIFRLRKASVRLLGLEHAGLTSNEQSRVLLYLRAPAFARIAMIPLSSWRVALNHGQNAVDGIDNEYQNHDTPYGPSSPEGLRAKKSKDQATY